MELPQRQKALTDSPPEPWGSSGRVPEGQRRNHIQRGDAGQPGGRPETACQNYQSAIDREELAPGRDYLGLSESFVIFVCDFDYYQKSFAVYERESHIKGCPELDYDDGTHVFLLNSYYECGNVADAVLEFLDYVRSNDDTEPGRSELVRSTKETMQRVRNDSEMEERYMTLAMKLRDERYAGR